MIFKNEILREEYIKKLIKHHKCTDFSQLYYLLCYFILIKHIQFTIL